jgi:hypothetical protein
MKLSVFLSIACASFLIGCGDKSTPATPATNVPTGAMNAPASYLGALASGQSRAIKTVDMASLNEAAQMFNVQEGRFPKDLNELVASKLIARIPDAPNGMKIEYDPATGKSSVVDN